MFRHTEKGHTIHAIVEGSLALSELMERLSIEKSERQTLLQLGGAYLNRQRCHDDFLLRPGDYIRIHRPAKRFPVDSVDWSKLTVFENDDLVICDKPERIPVHETLDNEIENVVYQLSQARRERLWVTHRLDQATQGLLVLGRSAAAASLFHEKIRHAEIRKHYLATTKAPVATGLHTAYMKNSPHSPKEISISEFPGALHCALEVEHCRKLNDQFEIGIRLITGRTHQIRCQLAALGAPILGDEIYGGSPADSLALTAYRLNFEWKGETIDVQR